MAQPETAAGVDPRAELPAEDLNLSDAEKAFEDIAGELLGEDEEEEEAPQEGEEVEGAEEGEETAEVDDLPAPNSLTAEEKEFFKTLPKEAKEFTIRRIGELERGFHAKSQEAATAREVANLEALRFAENIQAEAAQKLNYYAEQLAPEKPDVRLARTDPALYNHMVDRFHNAVAQREQAQLQARETEQRRQQYQAEIERRESQMFQARLQTEMPEAFDPANGQEFINELAATAKALDYDDDAISRASIEELKALKVAAQWKAKADKYDAAMVKKSATTGKKPTPTAKPGTPKGAGNSRARGVDAAWESVKNAKTGAQRNDAMAAYLERAGFI